MSTAKKSAPPPPAAAPLAAPPALDLAGKVDKALADKDDYVYVEVKHDGQTFVAWRSRNGAVHVENRSE